MASDSPPDRIDVLVFTPLPEELAALRELLGPASSQGTAPAHVRWDQVPLHRGAPGTLVAILPQDMDQVPAANTIHAALRRWAPRYVAVFGIGGALRDKIKLGDVIVGRYVLQWDAKRKERQAKDGSAATDLALVPHVVSEAGAEAANLLLSDRDRHKAWQDACVADSPAPPEERAPPGLHVDDIATGSAVIDSPAYRDLIASRDRKLLVVETEAAGVLAAVRSVDRNIETLVLRGVSDAASNKAETDAVGEGAWRAYAARNAARLLLALLREYLPGRPAPRSQGSTAPPPASAPPASTASGASAGSAGSQGSVPPTSARTLPRPGAAFDALYYLPRQEEADALERIGEPAGLLTVLDGPRGSGRTWLMQRLKEPLRARGYELIELDMRDISDEDLSSTQRLPRELAAQIAARLPAERRPDPQFHEGLSPIVQLRQFLMRAVDSVAPRPLALLIDQVELIWAHPSRRDFFNLLKGLCDQASREPWPRLRIVMTCSADLLTDPRFCSSAFAENTTVRVWDLEEPQVVAILEQHGVQPTAEDLAELRRWVGGHAYLVRLVAFEAGRRRVPLGEWLRDIGARYEQLERHLVRHLNLSPELWETLRRMLQHPTTPLRVEDEFVLKAAGLIERVVSATGEHRYQIRYQLYEEYVRRRCQLP